MSKLGCASIAALVVALVAAGRPVHAATVVHVALRDPSTGNGVTKTQIAAQPDRVVAGRVTFDVENQSKELVHEMRLLKQPDKGGLLPYDVKTGRVVEEKAVKLVDTDDIKPGTSVRRTATLQPGVYEMICNEPNHYAQGMKITFTVIR
jgi:uncharacterized cupredoxin-like copper-binding protein